MSDIIGIKTICVPCRQGRHSHDRFVNTGADAGCPNWADPSDLMSGCECAVVVAPIPPGRCPACGRPS